jgi:hypothetical protein
MRKQPSDIRYWYASCLIGAAFLLSPGTAKAAVQVPFAGTWETVGRATVSAGAASVTVAGGSIANFEPLGDCDVSFRARMPADSGQVQIWGAVRVKDPLCRYVVGLRGGTEAEVSLARYAPDAAAKFLGFAPLGFKPAPGQWCTVRVAVAGDRFHVYLNDEQLPRINVEDRNAPWHSGGVAVGGGWLATEFADVKAVALTAEARARFDAIGKQTWAPPAVDKEAIRKAQRAEYAPVKIDRLPAVRGDVSLDGRWLFMPDQDLAKGDAPTQLDAADDKWHVVAVPSFWTPFLGWLHGESGGLADMQGLSASRGPSDALVVEEQARADAQTFDWRRTKSGWYRHYVDLPADVSGKQFNLVFDAVAKISEVYVNGVPVGSNVGMFGRVDCDLTRAVRPGRNVIAVHVVGQPAARVADADKVEATAVSVAVTNEMLRSLPHGMAPADSSGIWQPVRLVVTNPVRVGDVFVRPRLDGASADVELVNGDARPRTVQVSYDIVDKKDGTTLDSGTVGSPVTIPANGKVTARLETPALRPKPWSPQAPNLYDLRVKLTDGGAAVDEKPTRFGFRTFAVSGSQLLLNGKPYWLRGGNHFPATLRPNDGALARRFIELARAGNVEVTRTHALPFTQAWLDAADEGGMGVSFEGTWPWLMIKGEPPPADLLKVWHDEFASLLRQNRNHPSVLFWTVNNEMNFANFDRDDLPLMKKKWGVLDDMIRTMRQVDPTRPVVAYSGYRRSDSQKGFEGVVVPNHFDDGDIDDVHSYNGWYNPTFFHLLDGQFGHSAAANRPLISQELSTGYPRNDGWPSRSYQFDRYVPEALVGDYSYEQSDPAIFLTRQAFMTKELAEVIRRTNRQNVAGILPFAYLTWFADVWKADAVRPTLPYEELKKAMQPVLVSAELFGRHFYAGDEIRRRVCIANDDRDGQEVPAGTLTWAVVDGERTLATGTVETPAVPYYANQWVDLAVKLPASLPTPRVNAKLRLTLTAAGRDRSVNDYDIVVASKEWAASAAGAGVQVFDPSGGARAVTAGLAAKAVTSLDALSPEQPLVVGDLAAVLRDGGGDKLKGFVNAGGRVLLLQPKADLVKLFPDLIKSYRNTEGEIVTMQLPDSPVFDGIEPLDTAWFEMGGRQIPSACGGTWEVDRSRPGVRTLAMQCDIHVEMKPGIYPKIGGAPLVEIRLGKGVVIASEMRLAAKDRDPIAGRLLANIVKYLGAGASAAP